MNTHVKKSPRSYCQNLFENFFSPLHRETKGKVYGEKSCTKTGKGQSNESKEKKNPSFDSFFLGIGILFKYESPRKSISAHGLGAAGSKRTQKIINVRRLLEICFFHPLNCLPPPPQKNKSPGKTIGVQKDFFLALFSLSLSLCTIFVCYFVIKRERKWKNTGKD